MMQLTWHKRVLIDNAKSVLSDATTYVVIAFVFLLWRFALGQTFEWREVAPFSEPSIFVRTFYSAFTFATLGALLYAARFYKVLHDVLVKTFGPWELYNAIKAVVWLGLMYVSYTYIVPWLFGVLNAGASVLFNIASLFLYATPPLGLGIIASILISLLKYRRERSVNM